MFFRLDALKEQLIKKIISFDMKPEQNTVQKHFKIKLLIAIKAPENE